MIVLPGKQYFEILVAADQYFSVSCTFPDYFNTLKFAGSDEKQCIYNISKTMDRNAEEGYGN